MGDEKGVIPTPAIITLFAILLFYFTVVLKELKKLSESGFFIASLLDILSVSEWEESA
ncbi:hypothetical protein [Epilithonimonas hungarica]|uniref:hypothetical protein n=1 Tax=Epilithonimonas hungarica TaxID=454006 RepID=UPI00158746BD|nr:hypothetical protein [Epilithonimonas hungarica]